ncbi:MAG: hypothetical protein R3F43_10525 [bacterium]
MRWSLVLTLALSGCAAKTDCPEGTTQFGDPPRKGFETVCKKEVGSRWVEHGPKRAWHMTGEKKLETAYVDGREEGVRTEWSPEGKKLSEQTFKAGKLEGKATMWGPDGVKLTETMYVAGEREGWRSRFTPTGRRSRRRGSSRACSAARRGCGCLMARPWPRWTGCRTS